jgi:hypothetical protein
MSGKGNNNNRASGSRPNMGNLLNLERVPPLAPKFANKLGKTAESFSVTYSGSGTQVMVRSMISAAGKPLASPKAGEVYPEVTLVEFERRVALANAPSDDERLYALKRKYELRLEKEFPAKGPASGKEADIQAWLGTLSLQERLALLKSQKDWEQSKSGPAKGAK